MVPQGVSDIENEMYVAVVEQAPLWELPKGSIDLEPTGPVVHGPWAAQDCAAVIERWVERGLVELYLPILPAQSDVLPADWQPRGEGRDYGLVLARADALALLRDPSRWTVETADGQASLSTTDLGESLELADWFADTVR